MAVVIGELTVVTVVVLIWVLYWSYCGRSDRGSCCSYCDSGYSGS